MGVAKLKLSKRISTKQKKWYFRFSIVLWLICCILAIIAYRLPLEVEQKFQTGLIKQKLDFKYTADVLPEGIISLNDAIFTKSQKQIKVNIESLVLSDEPVFVKGTSSVTVKLIAEELWEKTIQKYPEKIFAFKGKENLLIDMNVDIDLEALYEELERISNEIVGARSKNYYLQIKPEIKGEIVAGALVFPIQEDGEFILNLEGEQVKPAGERTFTKEVPVEKTILVKQVFSLFGLELDLVTSRYLFVALAILLSLILITALTNRIKNPKKGTVSEVMEIDKKYGIRLTPIQSCMDSEGKTYLELQTFKALVHISDEKDRGILKYEDKGASQVIYYLVDGDYIYSYKAIAKDGETAKVTHDGGDISYGI